jgi:hypothetical protein
VSEVIGQSWTRKYHWVNLNVGKEEGQLNHMIESEKEM